MNVFFHSLLIACAAPFLAPCSQAGQPVTAARVAGVLRPGISQPRTKGYSPSATAQIKSKALAMKDKATGQTNVSGNGTIYDYTYITDKQMRDAKTYEAQQRLLNPVEVKATDTRVRQVKTVVESQRPLVIEVPRDEVARVGTVKVDPRRLQDIEVETVIEVEQVTFIGKPATTSSTPASTPISIPAAKP